MSGGGRIAAAVIVTALGIARLIGAFGGGTAGLDTYNEGVKLGAKGDHTAAIAKYEKATKENPKLGIAWLNLGMERMETNDLPGAETATRKAAEIFDAGQLDNLPEGSSKQGMHAQVHANLSIMLAKQEKGPEALAQIRQAIQIDPNNANVDKWKTLETNLSNILGGSG
jgi:tetratricopeptide (TPR) repeat protein